MAARGHVPVLLSETVEALAVKRGGVYLDGTLGRAGHAAEILRRGAGTLIGVDRDPQALEESRARLSREFPEADVRYVHANHGDLAAVAKDEGFPEVDGVLLDLGVSSPQLDEPARGFSFRADGPLDMRMDPTRGETAAELVATRSEGDLAEIFRALGEEPRAKRVAKAIVRARDRGPIATTRELAEVIEAAVGRRGAKHPATRAFQALRMAVNDELGELSRALVGGLEALGPGGRFAVITFESLSDRMTKRFFAEHAGREESLQQGGVRWIGELPRVDLVFRRAVTAGGEELVSNVRSRSAKLRVAERRRA